MLACTSHSFHGCWSRTAVAKVCSVLHTRSQDWKKSNTLQSGSSPLCSSQNHDFCVVPYKIMFHWVWTPGAGDRPLTYSTMSKSPPVIPIWSGRVSNLIPNTPVWLGMACIGRREISMILLHIPDFRPVHHTKYNLCTPYLVLHCHLPT